MVKRLLGLPIAVVALAVAPIAATAAVAFEITTDPERPRVGEPVTILVATFQAGIPADVGGLEPLPLDEFPWTFVADSPSGRTFVVPLTRDASSINRWLARFAFDEERPWEIGLDREHLGTPFDPSLGARREVIVSGNDDQAAGRIVPLAFGALVVLGLLGWAGVAWLRAQRRDTG